MGRLGGHILRVDSGPVLVQKWFFRKKIVPSQMHTLSRALGY